MAYVKLPGGKKYGESYVVPCDIIRKIGHYGALVELSTTDGNRKWRQYVSNKCLLTDEEAEQDV